MSINLMLTSQESQFSLAEEELNVIYDYITMYPNNLIALVVVIGFALFLLKLTEEPSRTQPPRKFLQLHM